MLLCVCVCVWQWVFVLMELMGAYWLYWSLILFFSVGVWQRSRGCVTGVLQTMDVKLPPWTKPQSTPWTRYIPLAIFIQLYLPCHVSSRVLNNLKYQLFTNKFICSWINGYNTRWNHDLRYCYLMDISVRFEYHDWFSLWFVVGMI